MVRKGRFDSGLASCVIKVFFESRFDASFCLSYVDASAILAAGFVFDAVVFEFIFFFSVAW